MSFAGLSQLCLLILCQELCQGSTSDAGCLLDETCLLQTSTKVAQGHKGREFSEAQHTSTMMQSLKQFKVLNTESEEKRAHWEKIIEQLGKSLSSPKDKLQEFTIRGEGGLCPSCEADGHIYEALNFTNNKDAGMLKSVHLAQLPENFKPHGNIYAIDEYHLGQGLPDFRWCSILCRKWFIPTCTEDDSVRQNLWSRKSAARWSKFITPGSKAIDIGANVGDTTVEMALHAGQTLAFEANPRASLHCQTHSLLNPDLNIKVHPFAVSTDEGTMLLNVDCEGCNSGPVETRAWAGNVIQVPQKRLDTFLLNEHGEDFLKAVSFIKIDTEGYDKTLLRAYKPLLKFSKPTFWVEWFEPYHPDDQNPDEITEGSRDLFSAIAEIGYVPINPSTMKVTTPENRNGVADLLLLPAEKAGDYM